MPTIYDSKKDEIRKEEELIEEPDYPPPPTQEKPKKSQPSDDLNKGTPEQELEKTVKGSQRILFKAKTLFPFDLFPDELIIDENKIDIVSGIFFFSKDIFSIPIDNISGVDSSYDLFFGQLRIEAWGLNKNPSPIRFLSKHDAEKARSIINGLVMANKNDIDLKSIPLSKTKIQLEEIGTARQSVN